MVKIVRRMEVGGLRVPVRQIAAEELSELDVRFLEEFEEALPRFWEEKARFVTLCDASTKRRRGKENQRPVFQRTRRQA